MKILCACLIAAVAAFRKPVDVLAEIESKLGELKEMLVRPRSADMFEPNPSTTERNSALSPPPLDVLSAGPQPSYPTFPISTYELSDGKGRLRKKGT
jgi:hypothetical protein